jgi:hypothetical protein
MKRKESVLLFLATGLLLAPARADEPIEAERPGFTAGIAVIQRPQYELGVTRYQGGSRTVFNDGGLLRLPTKNKALEVRFGIPARSGSEWSDPALGAKWGFYSGAALIATAAKNARPQYALELERALSGRWTAQTDYVLVPDGTRAGALNLGYAVRPDLSVFAEIYSQGDGRWLDGGVTLVQRGNTQLDLNAGVGLERSNRKSNFVGVGLVRRW